jgi:hypothetical protein
VSEAVGQGCILLPILVNRDLYLEITQSLHISRKLPSSEFDHRMEAEAGKNEPSLAVLLKYCSATRKRGVPTTQMLFAIVSHLPTDLRE